MFVPLYSFENSYSSCPWQWKEAPWPREQEILNLWVYEKKLQYPVRVSKCDPRRVKFLIEPYGGADGELTAALRYLNQRYTLPNRVIAIVNDIGTEELPISR